MSSSGSGLLSKWIKANIHRFTDDNLQVDVDLMVVTWDREQGTGRASMNLDHIIWDIALREARNFQQNSRKKISN